MKTIPLILLIFLMGCASPNIKGWETVKGFEVDGNTNFLYKYKKDKDGNIEVEIDSRSEPIIKIEPRVDLE